MRCVCSGRLFGEIRLFVRVGCSAGRVGRCNVRGGVRSDSITGIATTSTISGGVVSISTSTVSIYFLLTTIGS